jgi:hypothetical protein
LIGMPWFTNSGEICAAAGHHLVVARHRIERRSKDDRCFQANSPLADANELMLAKAVAAALDCIEGGDGAGSTAG